MKNPTEPLIYDNGGKTLDRYTIVIPDGSVISMSQNGLGINMYIGDFQRDYNVKQRLVQPYLVNYQKAMNFQTMNIHLII
jgi:hypothetical protein